MILEALITQFNARFLHEKRAQVCLWFDEREEFLAILPALLNHLSQMDSPPFTLLAYDPNAFHGQIWLKHRIYEALKDLPPKKRNGRHFVIYLPLAEDRLNSPDDGGQNHLELLEEYRIAGTLFRINGKKPTLFSFLKQAGVALPSNPSEQRKLWEGGPRSLLARYVARFADRPALFWNILLTPETARSRLLGDIDRIILDFAVDPHGAWSDLCKKRQDREFLTAVAERYGLAIPFENPESWVRELVVLLALTETFLGYGEPLDFPFLDRLPSDPVRPAQRELLERWLRDAESRPAWDRWIRQVEEDIDLRTWAAERQGLSFGFPHLVSARWDQVYTEFKKAAAKLSNTIAFFKKHEDQIRREVEFARASHTPPGAWSLLHQLGQFVFACTGAEEEIKDQKTAAGLARLYVNHAQEVERVHVEIRREADERGLSPVARVADRAYAGYAGELNNRFFELYAAQGTLYIEGCPHVTDHLEETLWNQSERRAVLVVDGLRYDCALSIRSALRENQVEIFPLRAELPTITPIGMTALLPISSAKLSLKLKGNDPHPLLNDADAFHRKIRIAFLTGMGADCREIQEMESLSELPENAGDLLVLFGHDDVDHIGHGSADNLVRHLDLEIQRIVRLISKLHRWGYPAVLW